MKQIATLFMQLFCRNGYGVKKEYPEYKEEGSFKDETLESTDRVNASGTGDEKCAKNNLNAVPSKKKAWDALNKAKRRGQIEQQPCEVCGDLNSQAHHDNYNNKLDVRWLCQKHHYQLHVSRDDIGVCRKHSRETIESVLRMKIETLNARELQPVLGQTQQRR